RTGGARRGRDAIPGLEGGTGTVDPRGVGCRIRLEGNGGAIESGKFSKHLVLVAEGKVRQIVCARAETPGGIERVDESGRRPLRPAIDRRGKSAARSDQKRI